MNINEYMKYNDLEKHTTTYQGMKSGLSYLGNLHIQEKMMNIMKKMFKNTKLKVRNRKLMSKNINIPKGLKQEIK